MEHKANCWDVMRCERGPTALRDGGQSICPAALETRLHGAHGGHNGGRACWVVAGTLCGGEAAGDFAKKSGDCLLCTFYQQVKREERPGFKMSMTLLRQLGREV